MSTDGRSPTRRVALITGATSGLGQATALRLARRGWHVIAHGPDEATAQATAAGLRERVSGASVDAVAADLGHMRSVHALADDALDRYPHIDALVNNAAAVFDRPGLTDDGVERTFAVNYLGHYLLTRRLLPSLNGVGVGRVVTVASEAHHGATLDLDAVVDDRGDYERFVAYQRSKLACVMFSHELARRRGTDEIIATSVAPGMLRTRLFRPRNVVEHVVMPAINLRARRPGQAAEEIVAVLTSASTAQLHGAFLVRGEPRESSPESLDEAAARELWDSSARMTGLTP